MQTVLLHVTAGATGHRCELRRCTAGVWRTVAAHDLPDPELDRLSGRRRLHDEPAPPGL